MIPLDIGLAFDLRPDEPPDGAAPIDAYEELDGEDTVQALEQTLAELGHKPRRLGGGRELICALLARPPQLVFNLAEGRGSRGREGQVPSLCEMLGIACTGSDAVTTALTLDKALTKHVVRSAGLRTADFQVVEHPDAAASVRLPYPLFVKPVGEGSSMGVRVTSRVDDVDALRREVGRCLTDYRQPALVETYLPGAELTVALRGQGEAVQVVGAMGIEPADGVVDRFVYGLESKRGYKALVRYHVPPRLSAAQREDAYALAQRAYRLLGCRDLARIDLRCDARGRAHFIEVNPLPGLNPVTGDICLVAYGCGMTYPQLIGGIVEEAAHRVSR